MRSSAQVLEALRLGDKIAVPEHYEAEFEKAVLTFRCQRIYDPRTQVRQVCFVYGYLISD